MNVLDRLIGVFSPENGLRRANARAMLDQVDKRYGAARTGRRNKGWSGRGTSANVEVGQALATLRNRAREFVRDSWAGQRILDVLVSHVVGTGINVVPNTGSDRADRQFNLVREEWQEQADVEGVLDEGTMQGLALRSMVEGGDTVIRMIDLPMNRANGTVPFRLLGLEGDQIDTRHDSRLGVVGERLGVQLGDWGRREGLWLFEQHPGEQGYTGNFNSQLVAWNDLCHLYRPLRWGQVRGITWFACLLLTGREMQDLTEAAIVQARTQACFAAFMKRQPGQPSPFATQSGQGEAGEAQKVTRIEPGMVADIGESDIVFANPSSQSQFGAVYIAGMQAMAAGAGITYDQLTGDLRQANYSSLRAGKIEFRRLVEQIQWHIMAPRLVAPTTRRFIDRAIIAGLLPARKDGYPFDINMPANEPIDPQKDLDADIAAVRAGRMSPQEFISAWGRDWRKVVADTKTFFETVDAAKLALDIDGRRPARGGAMIAATGAPEETGAQKPGQSGQQQDNANA
ncbi:phage portal protein [Mesorhizobium sp.]|uniref:phage portal protein n=1 Tax=Mesorhizobium sp. TaxID=1871066 RepID=UPI000FEA8E45|nr:phage portal protein [Mesorhizobium sp.]RWN11770.1 MAG: phage portal protein [Mesorhizobium sp.]RWN19443.1 MAG: phage portal protein [Mesorhizobium sp.]